MTSRPARDISRATAQRDAGLARVSAVTLAVGLAGAAGAAALAFELSGTTQQTASSTGSTTSGQSSTRSDDDNASASSSNSTPTVKAPSRTQPHATSGGS